MSSRTLRALALATAALAASTALTACGSDDDSAEGTGSPTAEAKTINLGYFPNITHAPALVGVNKKLFETALGTGTKLETKTFNAGPAAIEAAAACRGHALMPGAAVLPAAVLRAAGVEQATATATRGTAASM